MKNKKIQNQLKLNFEDNDNSLHDPNNFHKIILNERVNKRKQRLNLKFIKPLVGFASACIILISLIIFNPFSNSNELSGSNDYLPITMNKNVKLEENNKNKYQDFALNAISKTLAIHQNENYVYSPMTHFLNLALLTALNENKQLFDVLGYEDLNDLQRGIANIFEATYHEATNQGENNKDLFNFLPTNLVGINKQLPYKSENLDYLKNNFYAAALIDNPNNLAAKIKKYILEKTANKIQIDLEPVDELILVSTLLYSDSWHSDFRIEKGIFHGENDKNIDYLKKINSFLYKETPTYQIIRISLKKSDAYFLLPKLNSDFDASTLNYQDMFNNLSSTFIDLSLPKFTTKFNESLKDLNKKLGLNEEYDANKINNFSKFSGDAQSTYNFFGLDEEGIVGASVTSLPTNGSSQNPEPDPIPIKLVFDHPFYYFTTYQDLITFAGFTAMPEFKNFR